MPYKDAEKRKEYAKRWHEENPEKRATWVSENKWRIKEYNKYSPQVLKRKLASIRKFPQKHNARNRLWRAVRGGKVTRPAECSVCFLPCRPEGHHPDYSRPLDVVWVCPPCHRELDKSTR